MFLSYSLHLLEIIGHAVFYFIALVLNPKPQEPEFRIRCQLLLEGGGRAVHSPDSFGGALPRQVERCNLRKKNQLKKNPLSYGFVKFLLTVKYTYTLRIQLLGRPSPLLDKQQSPATPSPSMLYTATYEGPDQYTRKAVCFASKLGGGGVMSTPPPFS